MVVLARSYSVMVFACLCLSPCRWLCLSVYSLAVPVFVSGCVLVLVLARACVCVHGGANFCMTVLVLTPPSLVCLFARWCLCLCAYGDARVGVACVSFWFWWRVGQQWSCDTQCERHILLSRQNEGHPQNNNKTKNKKNWQPVLWGRYLCCC